MTLKERILRAGIKRYKGTRLGRKLINKLHGKKTKTKRIMEHNPLSQATGNVSINTSGPIESR